MLEDTYWLIVGPLADGTCMFSTFLLFFYKKWTTAWPCCQYPSQSATGFCNEKVQSGRLVWQAYFWLWRLLAEFNNPPVEYSDAFSYSCLIYWCSSEADLAFGVVTRPVNKRTTTTDYIFIFIHRSIALGWPFQSQCLCDSMGFLWTIRHKAKGVRSGLAGLLRLRLYAAVP